MRDLISGRVSKLAIRFEKRAEPSRFWQFLSIPLSIIAALAVSSLLIRAAGADVGVALTAMYEGSFSGWREFLETLVQATPLIFTGLAATVAFRGKMWNIGAEGQLFAGAIAAYWVSTSFSNLPSVILVSMVVLASAVGGGVWGSIPGYLKAKFQADEIIITAMMNYIMLYLVSFLVSGPWRDPDFVVQSTARLPEAARLPILVPRTRFHAGFIISLIVAGLVYTLLWKTPLGYEIRGIGDNPKAVKFKGVNVTKTWVLIMTISGAIAGLAGGTQLFGVVARFKPDLSTGFGFTGIMVALLGGLNPLGVILASILFGALVTGSSRMQIVTGVPVALVYTIQGIVLIFLLTAEVLAKYRIRR